jgi:hypothetical protein
MKRYWTMLAALAVSTAFGGIALAGYHWPGDQVMIDNVARTAQGTMGTVRASSDNVQRIGCVLFASTGDSSAHVQCFATDATGNAIQCGVDATSFAQAAGAITGSSHIIFHWDATNTCTFLSVGNLAEYPPIQP